jgi:nitroreductase
MDNIIDIIKSRRSIRNYIDKPILKEDIDKLIESAKWAPSGMNNQPWGFIVVEGRSLVKELSDHSLPYIKKIVEENPKFARYKKRMAVKDFSIFYNAPCVIIVLGKTDAFSCQNDCAMAAQNMMLTAWSEGIGSCWVGMMHVLDKDKWFRTKFGIPEDYSVVAPIALGYFENKNIPVIERKEPGILKVFKG